MTDKIEPNQLKITNANHQSTNSMSMAHRVQVIYVDLSI